MSATTNKVPFGQKVAFGIGMLANQMFPAALGIFMVVLVQDLGFEGWQWSLIYFLPRIFDAFTDPIMGFISDNTKSRWGRRRQYVFIGALIMGISFVIMWQLYRENSLDYNFTYFMLWSFVFYLGLTIFSVPYVAMGYEMSDDFHERTDIMAIAQWIGQWAWVIAPWFWVIMYDPSWFSSADVATRNLAVWVGVACMLLAMVPAIFIKSKSTVNEDYAPLTLGNIKGSLFEIIDGFIEAFKSIPFRRLCIATFFIFNAFNTVAAFSFFIVVYYLFNGDAAAANEGFWPTLFGSLGALITTFAVIPTVTWMSKKMEKKKTFLVSQGISIFGYVLLWFLFIPGKPYMFIFALPFFSFGIGSLFTLMMSMTADVIDLDELNTGKRREGIFGAIYWWMVKFGFAIAGGLSGLILTYVGFDSTPGAIQTTEAITGLRLFFSGVPILGTLIAIFVMWNYSVSEDRVIEIRKELDKRNAPLKSTNLYSKNTLSSFTKFKYNKFDKNEIDFTTKSIEEIQELFLKTLSEKIHGLCFSPYEAKQNNCSSISKTQVNRRLGVISPYTNYIRTFSCTKGNDYIPKQAKENGLKTLVGAWLSNDKQHNEDELNSLIQLSKKGYVDVALIGNEVLMRNELSEEQLINYVNQFKKSVPNVPVGYVDAYYEFYTRPKLIEVCDIIPINCYPFWEGCSIEQSLQYLQQMYSAIKEISKEKKVIISETGWPNDGDSIKAAIPSSINAMKYFININNWSQKNDIELFYFSSFDEPWKVDFEGEVGQHWGIWDKSEKLKLNKNTTLTQQK